MLCNLNSLVNKVHLLFNYCVSNSVQVVGVCETWLSNTVQSSVVNIPGFNIFRNDSQSGLNKHGVGLYLSSSIKVGQVFKEHPNTLAIFLPEFNLYVIVVYRPPSNSSIENIALLSYLQSFCYGKNVVLMGDFNLPSISWCDDVPIASSSLSQLFLEMFVSLGLSQWVTFPTFLPSGNILDLVFTSEDDRISEVIGSEPFPGCGHVGVLFKYCISSSFSSSSSDSTRFDWYHCNYSNLSSHLAGIDWDMEFLYCDIDQCYTKFIQILKNSFTIYVPLSVKTSPKIPWAKDLSLDLQKRKKAAWRDFKHIRTLHGRRSPLTIRSWQYFKELNVQYKSNVIQAVSNYENTLVSSGDSKRLHGYLRQKKVERPTIGPLLVDGSWIDDCKAMSDCLADCFSSVFVSGVPSHPQPHQVSDTQFVFHDFTINDVLFCLNNLKLTASCGPDGIPSIVLRRCASVLCYPLFLIFRRSITSMRVPLIWKTANVMPLFKGGIHSNSSNYRPISLTSICSKTLERIIASQLHDYLDVHNLLSPFQFGFRAGLSVSDQLLLAYDYVSSSLDCGCSVDVLYFDYRKAFDVVNHRILLSKLSSIGISNPLLGWLGDFLCDRSMKVVVHNFSSHNVNVSSGVPQGSVIGPLLFLIYINHVTSGLRSKFVLFADDLKLYLALPLDKSYALDASFILQNDVAMLHRRSESWGLSFSVNKCARIHFSRLRTDPVCDYFIGDSPIPNKDSFRDLGVVVDSSLKFHLHINEVCRKANGIANSILRGTICRSPEFMVQVFITHIRPIIDFASVVWNTGYVGDLQMLESIQRRWTKKIAGFADHPYSVRLSTLNLFSIKGRLLRADLILVWKIMAGLCPSLNALFERVAHGRTRGHSRKIFKPRHSTDVRSRFFSLRVIDLWNSLPEEVVSVQSVQTFKRLLEHCLGPRLFEYC